MHWMSVKLPDNFQIHEHSWPCLFHIIIGLTPEPATLMLVNLKIIWQFHAHPVHQKVSRFFGSRYIRDDFFLWPNLVSFNRTVVPYEILSAFHVFIGYFHFLLLLNQASKVSGRVLGGVYFASFYGFSIEF
jgi:hypothetical protein